MPYDVQWHEQAKLVTVSLNGEVKGEEVVLSYQHISSDPRYSQNIHVLWDCRDIDLLDWDWPQLQAFKKAADQNCPNLPGKGRMAVVAPRHVVYTAFKAAWAITQKKAREKEVFRTIEEAVSWMNQANSQASYISLP